MPLPSINPPLLNSSNPWATTLDDLQALFDCPSTGAVTTRTSLLHGFEHDPKIHQHTFFRPQSQEPTTSKDGQVPSDYSGSLNTLGYSPIPLSQYLVMIAKVVADSTLPKPQRFRKPFIISVTGSAAEVRECYQKIQETQSELLSPLCMEINLSCPNIPHKPPPAYSGSSVAEYIRELAKEPTPIGHPRVAIGVKTPPYTYHGQFKTLIDALAAASYATWPIDFITATNTLGTSLVLVDGTGRGALKSASGGGIGGMAGAPLHPLALGNVSTISDMLLEHDKFADVDIIGVGGVSDRAGLDRMLAVGASVVGVGTALGREGVAVFEKILDGKEVVSRRSATRAI